MSNDWFMVIDNENIIYWYHLVTGIVSPVDYNQSCNDLRGKLTKILEYV